MTPTNFVDPKDFLEKLEYISYRFSYSKAPTIGDITRNKHSYGNWLSLGFVRPTGEFIPIYDIYCGWDNRYREKILLAFKEAHENLLFKTDLEWD